MALAYPGLIRGMTNEGGEVGSALYGVGAHRPQNGSKGVFRLKRLLLRFLGGFAACALLLLTAQGAFAATIAANTLSGWTIGGNASVDSAVGNPAPSWELPGDGAYMWRDDHTAYTTYSFYLKTQKLADFIFGANDQGDGYFFRVDTRGPQSFPTDSGFSTTTGWTAGPPHYFTGPTAGFTTAPPNAWINLVLTINGSTVTADATWSGGSSTATLTGYHPKGTAYGFQGDYAGSTTDSWISGLTVTALAATTSSATHSTTSALSNTTAKASSSAATPSAAALPKTGSGPMPAILGVLALCLGAASAARAARFRRSDTQ